MKRKKGGYKELQYKELRQRIKIGLCPLFLSKDNIYEKNTVISNKEKR
ncbi:MULTISPECIES: hypothetical protein [Bacillus cereus group]|nr:MULTISPECIES: hypothetical protein [Bacillus cereus group]